MIEITDLTNGSVQNNEWTGTGIFDVLINAVNKNIEIQCDSGRITTAEYGSVYSQSIQAVIAQSIEFILRKKLVESQIDNANKDLELKEEQINLLYTERVYKDKQTAMLGMDGVMKSQNVITDATHVYIPKYNNN